MKKTIALVVNTLAAGGAERTVSNLSRELSGKYNVDLVVNDDARIDYPYEGRLISLGMPRKPERTSAVYQLWALVRRTRILRRLKKRENYAAVVSFSDMTNLSNVLSGNRYGKTIASVHYSIGKRKPRGLRQRLVRSVVVPFFCRKADLTVSCSREIADVMIQEFGLSAKKSAAIYNGIDCEGIRKKAEESPSAAALPEGEKVLVTVGRLIWEKGHWHLIRAVKRLREDGVPVKLWILGEGELRGALEELVRREELESAVFLPGFVKNPYRFMAQADAVVFSSMTEGFSNAIVEALACGAPVISTDHETGAREILAPDTDYRWKTADRIEEGAFGILVPVCEGGVGETTEAASRGEALLAEAIRRVLTDDELAARYRRAALVRAKQLDIAVIGRQWIDVIEAE